MTSARRPTLADVAGLAGVAVATASNALSGVGRVAPATRAAVAAAAEELGYAPNRAARQLRSRTTNTIGIYIPETPTRSEYYSSFVFGIVAEAAAADLDVTLLVGGTGSVRTHLPAVDGVVIADPRHDDPTCARLLASSIPVVTCERVTGGPQPDGVVWADHGAAFDELFDHLRESGARRPGVLLPTEGDWAEQVTAAHAAWCAAHDAPVLLATIPWVPTADDLAAATDELLAREPSMDAVFAGPVDSAAVLLPHLRAIGKRVGTDLLLASGTDSTVLELCDPPITSIDLIPRTAGRRCFELLCEIIADRTEATQSVQLPIRVVRRASTARRTKPARRRRS